MTITALLFRRAMAEKNRLLNLAWTSLKNLNMVTRWLLPPPAPMVAVVEP